MNMVDIKCVKCGEAVSFEVPAPQINNQITFSQIILIHEKPQSCPKCQTLYTAVIQGIDQGIAVAFVPLQKKPTSNIVAPNTNDVMQVNRTKGSDAKIVLTPGA